MFGIRGENPSHTGGDRHKVSMREQTSLISLREAGLAMEFIPKQ